MTSAMCEPMNPAIPVINTRMSSTLIAPGPASGFPGHAVTEPSDPARA
jgi:hypothetical protein